MSLQPSSCSAASLDAGEPLAGTASRADTILLVEVRGAWERDVLDAPGRLGTSVTGRLRSWVEERVRAKVLFVRRPDRRAGDVLAFVVRAAGGPPSIRRFALSRHDELAELDLDGGGELVAEPIALVCGHGRRDPCCARLGTPVFDALRDMLGPEELWLSSHQGGHRFAPNLLWLPEGFAFGRVAPATAQALVAELRAGRLPTASLRGRITLAPEAQAAEIAARDALGLEGIADAKVVEAAPGLVRLATAAGPLDVGVASEPGPPVPASCGAEPEPTVRYTATVVR